MAVQIARFRNIALTQGGADLFVQAEEITGIDPSSQRGWMLTRFELNFPYVGGGLKALSADSQINWSISRDSKAVMSNLSDSDIIMEGGFHNSLTTSGQIVVPATHIYEFTPGVIVVEPSLYFQLDSDGTGLTLDVDARLYYEEIKLSEVEILRMLTQG